MTKPPRHPMFKQRHFDDEIILLCVRWYVTYKLSYRDLAAMVNRPQVLLERRVSVAPSTISRNHVKGEFWSFDHNEGTSIGGYNASFQNLRNAEIGFHG